MDQKKTGYFLKQLRNEKKLTQEQLAEKFQITSRTVSRWETGSNMPDISMLLELADFYEVDIREIIDGERKSEQMNEELKETVIKVTDYTETNNARLLKRVRIIGITGVITILIAMVMDAGGLAVSPFWESVKRDLYAWTLGTLIANILYTTGWLKRISEKKRCQQKDADKRCGMCGDCDYIAGFAGCFIEKHMTGGKSLPFFISHAHFLLKQEMVGHQKIMK